MKYTQCNDLFLIKENKTNLITGCLPTGTGLTRRPPPGSNEWTLQVILIVKHLSIVRTKTSNKMRVLMLNTYNQLSTTKRFPTQWSTTNHNDDDGQKTACFRRSQHTCWKVTCDSI